jgi:hypothetical protein
LQALADTAKQNARIYHLEQSNARLLKALEGVNNWWMTTPSFQDGDDDMPAEIFDAMQYAIDKERGRQ